MLVVIKIIVPLLFKDDSQLFIEKFTTYIEIFSFLFSISIFFYAFHVLSKKENLFIKILSFDNLRWLYTFFKLGLFSYVFWIVALAVTLFLGFSDFIYAYYPLRIFTTILIYWIGFQAIKQLNILSDRKKIREKTLQKNKEQKQNQIVKTDNKDFEKIKATLLDNNFFAEPKLTVDALAKKVDFSTSKTSAIIKQETNKNFNDFINEFRIEFTKQMLIDNHFKNYTITAIGLEAGFNSKSSFYAIFKKHTGYSPLEFQKNNI